MLPSNNRLSSWNSQQTLTPDVADSTKLTASSFASSPQFKAVKDQVDEVFPADGPGVNLVVMNGSQLLGSYSVGYADIEKKEPSNINSRQHFGSVSKHFTAACIINLANEKNPPLKLSDNIRDYIQPLPKFNFDGKEVEITIEDLLRMRSGLPNMQALEFLNGMSDQDASSEQKLDLITSQESVHLSSSPGTQFHYCNTNYDLLAKIVEVALKRANHKCKDLREYAEKKLLKPSGMNNTGFINPTKPIEEQTIPGYELNDQGEPTLITSRNTTWGPCGIIGTAEDMVKWNGNCPPDVFEALSNLPDQSTAYNNFDYARGLSVGFFDNNNYKISAHSGGIEGFITRYVKVDSLLNNRKSFSIFLSANCEKLPLPVFDNFVNNIVNTIAGKLIIPVSNEDPPHRYALSEGLSREEAQKFSMDCAVDGWKTIARLSSVQLPNGKWGIKFLPNSKESEKGFTFVPEEGHPYSFRSLDPPTAQLIFNENGVIFSDLSQSVQEIMFKKFMNR